MRGRARPRSWTRPWCSRLLVEVSRALIAIAAYGGVRRADERRDAVPGQCRPEIVVRRTVAGGELLPLTPRAIRLGEHIERALACVAADSGLRRTDEYGRALERD